MDSLQDGYMLRNGVKIPCIGFGTWKSPDDVVCESVKMAIQAGYRHIDGAAAYPAGVGKGIRESGVPREELFITSKLPNADHGYEKAKKSFDKTLEHLGLDYLTCILIHWPVVIQHKDDYEQDILDTWRAFEELYGAGKIRAIGVSNFMIEHLEIYKEPCKDYSDGQSGAASPAASAGRDGCLLQRKPDRAGGVRCPLIQGQAFKRELLKEMAAKYDRTVAQICIRWIVQKGVIPLPKASSMERISGNADVFDFEIGEDDMEKIATLRTYGMIGEEPELSENKASRQDFKNRRCIPGMERTFCFSLCFFCIER